GSISIRKGMDCHRQNSFICWLPEKTVSAASAAPLPLMRQNPLTGCIGWKKNDGFRARLWIGAHEKQVLD
ncbi:hypothetical protein, partial [Serratia marcescens]